MLDIKILRQNPELVTQKLSLRGYTFPIESFDKIEEKRKYWQQILEQSQQQRNQLSAQLQPQFKLTDLEKEKVKQEVLNLKESLDNAQQAINSIEKELNDILVEIPNILDDSVPIGNSEEDNVVVKTYGQISRPIGDDHVDMLKKSQLLLLDEGVALSGSRFYALKGPLARLQRALVSFMLDFHATAGYIEHYVPYLVSADTAFGTGQLPKFEEDMFCVNLQDNRKLFLIPTAELPLTNLYADKILEADAFPIRIMAHTPCFRSEVGSYGKDTKGIFRVHQFDKVELVHLCLPEDSNQEHDRLIHQVEQLLIALELPFRISLLCSKDTGFGSAKTFDFEVWLPGQQKYREISSCSNFKDFQARRMKGRYRVNSKDKPSPFHTLNGSGVAVGRALIALVENFGTAEGCSIPKALQPYLGGSSFISWK